MYPSTLVNSSIGGFLAEGSGGIGTDAHGGLCDFDTVRGFEVATMDEVPRVVMHEGDAVHEVLHAWGTAAFKTYDQAFTFGESIACGCAWTKRLVTVFEWPIPSFFTPVKHIVR